MSSVWDDPKFSFTYSQKVYDVPCCFQIWRKRTEKRSKEVRRDITELSMFLEKTTPQNATVAIQRVGANAGKIKTENLQQLSEESHYFFKTYQNSTIEKLQRLDFSKVKYNTAGNPSIGIHDIVTEWFN